MFDTEKFIIEIEGKPSVWDITSSDYQNKDKKLMTGEIYVKVCVKIGNRWTQKEGLSLVSKTLIPRVYLIHVIRLVISVFSIPHY
jgi:hypothetical protein